MKRRKMNFKNDDQLIVSASSKKTWARIFRYWLPPIFWMAFIFPVGNRLGSSPLFYRLIEAIVTWINPDAPLQVVEIVYIFLRKSFHFIEYGFLAALIFRALRQDAQENWLKKWLIWSGIGAGVYAGVDEFLQAFIPSRNGSGIDLLIDWLGITCFLWLILHRFRQKFFENVRYTPENYKV